MRIQNVTKKKRTTDCIIKFDNDEEIVLSMDIVLKYQLSKNKEITTDTLKEINTEQQRINIKQDAFNYASYKPRTVKQVQQKLEQKGYFSELISVAINFLVNFELLDDKKFALTFAKEYAHRKNAGPFKIENELIRRGIEPELAKDAVSENYPDEKTIELAREHAKKKVKMLNNKSKDKKYRSLRDSLLRNGFDIDTVSKVIKEVLED